MKWLFHILLVVALAGCAPRDPIIVAPDATGGAIHPVFVGTTRGADPETLFGSDRSAAVSYARFDISVPPDHAPGDVERSRGGADPARHFLATSDTRFADAAGFSAALAQVLRQKPRGGRAVTIYVHGFNNSFADGVYRIAQMQHDMGLADVAVHYSWPSAAHPLGYGYDRDSMLFARDGLEELIRATRAAGAEDILLVAHSMGSLLTVEVLRQMAIGSGPDLRQMLDGVVLISADIDVDVFKQQLRRTGPLPQPFVILTSSRDRALQLSARLSGRAARLGNVTDPAVLADHEVTLINVSDFSEGLGHFPAATSPELIALLRRLNRIEQSFADDPSARIGLIPGTVVVVQNVTGIILSRPPG